MNSTANSTLWFTIGLVVGLAVGALLMLEILHYTWWPMNYWAMLWGRGVPC